MKDDHLLLTIYIGQEINFSRGILYKFKEKSRFGENENKIIDSLLDRKLVERKQPYTVKSIISLVTTEVGKREARRLIQEILQSRSTLLDELGEIPRKALGFLIININSRIFEKSRQEWFKDWKDFILYKTKMFDFSLRFCQILQKYHLTVLTNDYASSHGGRIDQEKYVVPEEAKDYLIRILKPDPLSNEEINQSILFYTLHKIRKDILPIKDERRRRSNYWNLLRVLPFDESTIKSVIGKFKEDNITTEYSEIENEQFLFSILDEARFDIKLDRMVEDFTSSIVHAERTGPRLLAPRAPEPLKMHSELFVLIGGFEMRFRAHLISEMRAIFKEDKNEWYDQLKEISLLENQSPFKTLHDKLESRKGEDLKNKILPEDELIYYADITDYKDIILKNWELFEGRFRGIGLGKEKFEHGMTELNRIRRKVMHLRDIRSSEAKTLRLYIIPELEKIFT
jgi:hypothetical protein